MFRRIALIVVITLLCVGASGIAVTTTAGISPDVTDGLIGAGSDVETALFDGTYTGLSDRDHREQSSSTPDDSASPDNDTREADNSSRSTSGENSKSGSTNTSQTNTTADQSDNSSRERIGSHSNSTEEDDANSTRESRWPHDHDHNHSQQSDSDSSTRSSSRDTDGERDSRWFGNSRHDNGSDDGDAGDDRDGGDSSRGFDTATNESADENSTAENASRDGEQLDRVLNASSNLTSVTDSPLELSVVSSTLTNVLTADTEDDFESALNATTTQRVDSTVEAVDGELSSIYTGVTHLPTLPEQAIVLLDSLGILPEPEVLDSTHDDVVSTPRLSPMADGAPVDVDTAPRADQSPSPRPNPSAPDVTNADETDDEDEEESPSGGSGAGAGVGVVLVVGGCAWRPPPTAVSEALRSPVGRRLVVRSLRGLVTDPGRRIWWKAPVVLGALYTRRDDTSPLENETRQSIFDAVKDTPGIYHAKLATATGATEETVRYHCRILVEEGLVETRKHRGRRRVYPVQLDDVDPALSAALADSAAADVLAAIERQEPTTCSELASALDSAASTIVYHLDRLEEDGLIVRERTGESVTIRLRVSARSALEKRVTSD